VERIKYRVVFSHQAKKQLLDLDRGLQKEVYRIQKEKLENNPIEFGKPLRHDWIGYRRIRIGKIRIIYKIEKEIVEILAIGHRQDIYN